MYALDNVNAEQNIDLNRHLQDHYGRLERSTADRLRILRTQNMLNDFSTHREGSIHPPRNGGSSGPTGHGQELPRDSDDNISVQTQTRGHFGYSDNGLLVLSGDRKRKRKSAPVTISSDNSDGRFSDRLYVTLNADQTGEETEDRVCLAVLSEPSSEALVSINLKTTKRFRDSNVVRTQDGSLFFRAQPNASLGMRKTTLNAEIIYR